MKRFEADDAYRLANMFFPDDGDLALFNLVIEVMNGKLLYEVIDGPADVVEAEGTDLAAAVGMATIGQSPCRISWVFDQDHADKKEVLLDLVRGLKLTPQPKEVLDLERPPFTLATLAACEGEDGRFAYALFRHPSLDADQARAIVAAAFPPEAPDASEDPPAKN